MGVNGTQNLNLSRFLISQEFMIFLKIKSWKQIKTKIENAELYIQ